jgi:phosphate-selective porin OprO/OprP
MTLHGSGRRVRASGRSTQVVIRRCHRRYIVPHLGAAALLVAFAVHADEAGLRARIEAQEQRILELERKLDAVLAHRSAAASSQLEHTTNAASDKPPASRFVVASTDGGSSLRLRGLIHFDGRYFANEVAPASADGWVLRRARPTFEGSFAGVGEFRLTPEFGGGRSSILDASLAVRLSPSVTITAGKFKVPVGLERIMSASDLRFIERGFPTSLVPNRDLGLQIGGGSGRAFEYSFGYFNGVSDGASGESNDPTPDAENDSSGDWAARVFVKPFADHEHSVLRDLGFGVAGTYTNAGGDPNVSRLATLRTPGQQVFFRYSDATFADGTRVRMAPQFYYYLGPLGVLTEYTQVAQDVRRATSSSSRAATIDTRAWQLQIAWMLTGERESFKGNLTPARPFSIDAGGWGAFELVARYHEIDIDDAAFVGADDAFADTSMSASGATAWGIGLNWRLNDQYSWSLNYDRTRFNGGSASKDRSDEQAVLTRFGVAF